MVDGRKIMNSEAASCGLAEGHKSETSSRQWAGNDAAAFSLSLVRSPAVSVAAVKYCGEFTHPMGKVRGKPIKGCSYPDCGNVTPNLGMSAGIIPTLYKPFTMSSLAIYTSPKRGVASRIVRISRKRVLMNCMDSAGATRAEGVIADVIVGVVDDRVRAMIALMHYS
jgi:hypothetical protein